MDVPLGAMPGFSLKAEVRFVASYYGVSMRHVRSGLGHAFAKRARHALFWRLAHRRNVAIERIASMLQCPRETVRDGIAQHIKRIEEFQANAQLGSAPR